MLKIKADRYKNKTGFNTKSAAINFIKNIYPATNLGQIPTIGRAKKNETNKAKTVRENKFLLGINKARILYKKSNKNIIVKPVLVSNIIINKKNYEELKYIDDEGDNQTIIISKINNYVYTEMSNMLDVYNLEYYAECINGIMFNNNSNLFLNSIRSERIINPINKTVTQKTNGYNLNEKNSDNSIRIITDLYNNIELISINNSASELINKIINEFLSIGINMMAVQLVYVVQVIQTYDHEDRTAGDGIINTLINNISMNKLLHEDLTNIGINISYVNSNLRQSIVSGSILVSKTVTIGYDILQSFIQNNICSISLKVLNTILCENVTTSHYGDAFIYCITGLKVLPVMNGVNINSIIGNIKAFSPNVDYSYHEATKCSTTKDRLCIYESYYYLYIDSNSIISKNVNKIKQMLETESDKIKLYIKNGELSNFLIEKSLETKEVYYVEFYRKIGEYYGFKIENGNIIPIDNINGFEDIDKIFLYDKQHVAPRKITKTRKDNGYRLKQYSLRPSILKYESKDKKTILGYDFETYCKGDEGQCVPYCLCLSNGKTFYGNNVVKEFCDYLDEIKTETNISKTKKKEKVEKIYIYGFNNSRFDNLLLFGELYDRLPSLKYCIMGNSIKYIKYHNICIYDLNLYYAGSLSSVSRSFKLDIKKGVFPYKYVNEYNLNYIGNIPDIEFWNSKEDYEEYKKIEGNTFDMKEYTIKYCKLDSKLVEEIAKKHNENCCGSVIYCEKKDEVYNNEEFRKKRDELYKKENGKMRDLINLEKEFGYDRVEEHKYLKPRFFNVSSSPTGAGLSLKMFQQVFLNSILYASPDDVQTKERSAYYGGRTEVFKKKYVSEGDNKLYYYDINSSYPYAMTYMMPYQYLNTIKVGSVVMKEFVDYNLYKAKSEYKGNDKFFIPNLVHRSDKGDIIAIKNAPEGYHWGCELNEAVKNNCEITVSEIIQYEGREIFKTFANYFYSKRLEEKPRNAALAEFLKLIMNSLYGKFGQSLKPETKICHSADEISIILNDDNNKLQDFQLIGDKVVLKYVNLKKEEKSVGNLIRFSSYISAVAKCNLSIFMRDVGHENVYYCDTDSVFTTKAPSDHLVSQSELGKWKLESVEDKDKNKYLAQITDATFLAPKSYMYNIGDKYTCMKAKGQPSNKVTAEHFIDAEAGKEVSIKNDTMFFRSLEGVQIRPQARSLSVVYNKRIFIGNDSMPYDNYEDWYKQKYNPKNNI